MSDTPRTDAEECDAFIGIHSYFDADDVYRGYGFARQLERELTAANERIKKLEEALVQLEQCNFTDENCASLEVATKRIRNFARQIKGSK